MRWFLVLVLCQLASTAASDHVRFTASFPATKKVDEDLIERCLKSSFDKVHLQEQEMKELKILHIDPPSPLQLRQRQLGYPSSKVTFESKIEISKTEDLDLSSSSSFLRPTPAVFFVLDDLTETWGKLWCECLEIDFKCVIEWEP
ncbi:expressed unknown protein [Seminavis robusta]|uniref:Uncharacterized protein n=1 Tax=Seminavis robusta TaxID=568900 RepID=A0A9N8E428_9STRA|nr:expressed unknown protein [Seminavis robusta]|eukprot:Sro633_g178900.1 n/a (145) ;mRNA; f:44532-44966